MADSAASFEVEIRCHFEDVDEACRALPFVRSCLGREAPFAWTTRYYGLDYFRSGGLLRVAEVFRSQVRYYLGWKGPDIGTFANIRQELDEEITQGIGDSLILKRLQGSPGLSSRDAVIGELERLGHREFMSFSGSDLTGYDDSLGIKLKVMTCPMIKWPLLLELEKTANSEAEAARCEDELRELTRSFGLQSRLVRQEPPSLLYDSVVSREAQDLGRG